MASFGAGIGRRPYQVRAEQPRDKARALTEAPKPGIEPSLVDAVLDEVHQSPADAVKTRVNEGRGKAELKKSGAVAIEDGRLLVAGTEVPLTAKQQRSLTLLSPNAVVIAALHGALKERQATLISAADGSGASHTIRSYLAARKLKHAYVELVRTTSIDTLAGARRPDAQGELQMSEGPLTHAVRTGSVLVVRGIENADPQITSCLAELAKGAAVYHHPVTHMPIPVHPGFRLILVGSQSHQLPRELLGAKTNLVEVRAYDEREHAQLLVEQDRLPRVLADRLAAVHEALRKKWRPSAREMEAGARPTVDYGRDFAFAWPLLHKVGRRLSNGELTDDRIAEALYAVYGARVSHQDASHREVLATLEAHGFRYEAPRPSKSTDPTYVHSRAADTALAQAEGALLAKESVLLSAPGQAGVDRLVHELGRRLKLTTTRVVCHAGIDPDALMEMPVFDKDGQGVFMRPGRISAALLSGGLLYIDHLDHLSPERQQALLRLQRVKELSVLQDGKLVKKPVSKDTRIVFATTEGAHKTRFNVSARERAALTEIHLDRPSMAELRGFLPRKLPNGLADAIMETIEALAGEGQEVRKLRRFIDFARAAELLSGLMPAELALYKAAKLLFPAKESATLRRLERAANAADIRSAAEKAIPIYQKLLGLTPKKVQAALEKLGYEIVESMESQLDSLAIAAKLHRHVLALGPPAQGKTVQGEILAELLGKPSIRFNVSTSTDAHQFYGGIGPVPDGQGGTSFEMVPGPSRTAAELEALLLVDEINRSSQADMLMKSMVDAAALIDPEANIEKAIGTTFIYATGNETNIKTGRHELSPTFTDCMFVLHFPRKSNEEKVRIVGSQTTLPTERVKEVVTFFEALGEALVTRPEHFKSRIGPISCTERDMLKVAGLAEHLIRRDGVTDPAEQRRIVGQIAERYVRSLILAPNERRLVHKTLIRNHFGEDIPEYTRPKEVETVQVKVDGAWVQMLQIGIARFPIQALPSDPELLERIPGPEKVSEPIGPQLEWLETALLLKETGQPGMGVGVTGGGKTMLLRYLHHRLHLPLWEDPYSDDTTEEQVYGRPTIVDDDLVFRYGQLPLATGWRGPDAPRKPGGTYNPDEYLLFQDREKVNPVLEGKEMQISQKRGGETIRASDWSQGFWFFGTTNADDVRQHGFSDPEASRLWLMGLPELSEPEDIKQLAARDYALAKPFEYKSPEGNRRLPRRVSDQLTAAVPPGWLNDALRDALDRALAGKAEPKLQLRPLPPRRIEEPELRAIADAAHVFGEGGPKPSKAVLALLDHLVVQSQDGCAACTLLQVASVNDFSPELRKLAKRGAVHEGRLVRPGEAVQAAEIFCQLRELQLKGAAAGKRIISPLTPRLLSTFMEAVVHFRGRFDFALAALKAAEYTLLPKLGPALEQEATQSLLALVHDPERVDLQFPDPVWAEDGVWFGEVWIKKGERPRSREDSARYPMTPSRIRNMSLWAEGMALSSGRAMCATDDDNGENLEMLRELARLTGRAFTEVFLPPNVDLDSFIEKLARVKSESELEDFAPELQKIGRAVKDGHILAIRGDVPSAKLERLNSLGDGRNNLYLPQSAVWMQAHPELSLVLLRKPNARNHYSQPLENRIIEPPLTTREGSADASLGRRVGELAAVLEHRTGISAEAAGLISKLHTVVNELLAMGVFVSGRSVGSFLQKDAEGVALRLAYLQANQVTAAVLNEAETLHLLARDVYGDRLTMDVDRASLDRLLGSVFETQGNRVSLSSVSSSTPTLVRFGPWTLTRDSQAKEGVPEAESELRGSSVLNDVLRRMMPALQLGEVVHLHGNEFVSDAAVKTIARSARLPLVEIEGNPDLSEAYLFGGLVENPDTNRYEDRPGVVAEAQASGSLLVIKNASRLPAEIRARLATLAGSAEERANRFRLVLVTNETESLDPELAKWSTSVRCRELTQPPDLHLLRQEAEANRRATGGAEESDHELLQAAHRQLGDELQTVLAKLLVGVPGGALLASELLLFAQEAGETQRQSLSGQRQRGVRFDSSRLLEVARQISRGWRAQESAGAVAAPELEPVLVDVLLRLYLLPLGDSADPVTASFGRLLAGLSKKDLVAAPSVTFDTADRPELEGLMADYRKLAPAYTWALSQTAAEAIVALYDRGRTDELRALFRRLADSRLFGASLGQQLEALAASETVDPAAVELLRLSLADHGSEKELSIRKLGVAFLRGARLFDLEHRHELLGRYHDVFTLLAEAGSERAPRLVEDMKAARSRFDEAGSVAQLQATRRAVTVALDRYSRAAGKSSPALAQLIQQLSEAWDLIASQTLFSPDSDFKDGLQGLEVILGQLEHTHQQRAAAGFQELSLTLHAASDLLVGVRIAEQTVELRRGLARSALATTETVDRLREELATIDALQAAEKTHRWLSQCRREASELQRTDPFLHLMLDTELSEPELRKDSELRLSAALAAQPAVDAACEVKWNELLAKVNLAATAQKGPAAAHFWDSVVLEHLDLGLTLEPQSAAAASPFERALQEAQAELSAYRAKIEAQETEARFSALKVGDQARALRDFASRAERRATQVAAKVGKLTRDLSYELGRLAERVDLNQDKALADELTKAQEELHQAALQAGTWSTHVVKSIAAVGDAVVDTALEALEAGMAVWQGAVSGMAALFGLPSPEPTPKRERKAEAVEAPPALDLSEVQGRARVVLEKVIARIDARIAALPDFARRQEHVRVTEELSSGLIHAQSLGDLASTYRTLTDLAGVEARAELRDLLGSLARGMAREADVRQLLLGVSHFLTSAELLSSEVAGQSGVPLAMAPVIEELMRAADRVSRHRRGTTNFRDPMAALTDALSLIDKCSEGGEALPALIAAARGEMAELLACFERLQSHAKEVKVRDADASEMLRLLEAKRREVLDVTEAVQPAVSSEAVSAQAVPEDATSRTIRERFLALRKRPEALTEGTVIPHRSAISVVELSFYRPLAPDPASEVPIRMASLAEGEGDPLLLERRRAVASLGEETEAFFRGATDGLEEDRASTVAALDRLEASLKVSAAHRWMAELDEAALALSRIFAAEGASYRDVRVDVAAAKGALMRAEAGLSALFGTPSGVVGKLRAALEEAKTAETAYSNRSFEAFAHRWSASAMELLRDAQAELFALVSSAQDDAAPAKSVEALLQELSEKTAALAGARTRAGAWSRFLLLSSVHRTVAAVADVLPPAAKALALATLAQAQAGAETLARISGGAQGERALADLGEAYVELTRRLQPEGELTDEHVQGLRELGHDLTLLAGVTAPGDHGFVDELEGALTRLTDLDGLAPGDRAIQGLVRELSASLGSLRSLLCEGWLDDAELGFRRTTSEHLKQVGEARAHLIEARDRFLSYDPLAEKASLAELAREIQTAIGRASARMTGPAMALFLQEIRALAADLSRALGGPRAEAFRGEAQKLLSSIDEMVEAAEKVPDASAFERLERLFELTANAIAAERSGGPKAFFLRWLEEVQAAIEQLLALDRPEEMLEQLAALEAGLFKDHLPQERPEEPRAAGVLPPKESDGPAGPGAIQAIPVPELVGTSAVEALLRAHRGRGGALSIGLGSAGGSGALSWGGGPPPEPSTSFGPGATAGTGEAVPHQDAAPVEVQRAPLDPGVVNERSDRIRPVVVPEEQSDAINERIQSAAEMLRTALGGDDPMEPNNDFEAAVATVQKEVQKLIGILREHPNTELVLVLDQSGSTDGAINRMLRLTAAMFMKAVMDSESNCALVGFGDASIGAKGDRPVSEQQLQALNVSARHVAQLKNDGIKIFLHKPMKTRLDSQTADVVYKVLGNVDGNTDLIAPMNVAYGQFTDREDTQKVVVVLTDACVSNPGNVRRQISVAGQAGIATAMLGVGDALHIEACAGNLGAKVTEPEDMIEAFNHLIERALATLEGKKAFQGSVTEAGAAGTGVPANQYRLSAARNDGPPLPAALRVSAPANGGQEPSQIYVPKGPRRELPSLADRAVYEQALSELEVRQRAALNTPELRACLQEASELVEDLQTSGTVKSVQDSVSAGLPRAAGSAWEYKQTSGSHVDENQIPYFKVAARQHLPFPRLWKRRRPHGDLKSDWVLVRDGSFSTDGEKQRLQLQGEIALLLAISQADPHARVAILEFGDRVTLHKGFEQPIDLVTIAHLLLQARSHAPATDDERGCAEGLSLLRMVGSEVGILAGFTDGAGMPGAQAVVEQAASEGYAAVISGIGPESKAVIRFGDHACYGRNLTQWAQNLGDTFIKAWEKAGRVGR